MPIVIGLLIWLAADVFLINIAARITAKISGCILNALLWTIVVAIMVGALFLII